MNLNITDIRALVTGSGAVLIPQLIIPGCFVQEKNYTSKICLIARVKL